jgi:hypothetical protein
MYDSTASPYLTAIANRAYETSPPVVGGTPAACRASKGVPTPVGPGHTRSTYCPMAAVFLVKPKEKWPPLDDAAVAARCQRMI